MTGLAGNFDVVFEWRGISLPSLRMARRWAGWMPSGPTFEQALRAQLGIKLESRKGPVKVTVIDHVERPSAN
jgi:uncharacterized protein (TIGR03435 family)